MKEKTAIFIGHRIICSGLEDMVEAAVIHLIGRGVDTFFNGGMGDFDLLCARRVGGLKERFPGVRHFLVAPYMGFRCSADFDGIFYPNEANGYFKGSILRRNNWMVDQAAYAVCYIEQSCGGAARTYHRALRQGLTVMNLA